MVDRNRLITALQLKNEDSFGDFAWGQQLNEEVLHSVEIQGLGNLQVPFSVEVSLYVIFSIIILKSHSIQL